jgi:hypothetical protein
VAVSPLVDRFSTDGAEQPGWLTGFEVASEDLPFPPKNKKQEASIEAAAHISHLAASMRFSVG